MRKSIFLLTLAALAVPLTAAEKDAEWRGVRRELEKQGVKVDHFAKTPAERERELANIRRQLEKANDPAAGASMRSIGGAAYTPKARVTQRVLGRKRRL